MKTKNNQFESNVAHNLRGVHFFSPGACKGCDDCGLAEKECPSCGGDGKQFEHASDAPCPVCNGTGQIEASDRDYELASEPGFSWSSCDSCGSTLGGNREPAHGIIAPSMEEAQSKDREITHFSICTDCVCYHANGDLPHEG